MGVVAKQGQVPSGYVWTKLSSDIAAFVTEASGTCSSRASFAVYEANGPCMTVVGL